MVGALLDLLWRSKDSPEPSARLRKLRTDGLVAGVEG